MEEPVVDVHVEGSRELITGPTWPPKAVEHRPLYLRPRRKLSPEPELTGAEHAFPDGFYQAPLTVTDRVEILSWRTDAFTVPTGMIGTGAAHLFVEIDQPDTNFILRFWDEAPGGKRQLVTTAYLKASHRELDPERSTEGSPVHPHARAVPVGPGTIGPVWCSRSPRLLRPTEEAGHHMAFFYATAHRSGGSTVPWQGSARTTWPRPRSAACWPRRRSSRSPRWTRSSGAVPTKRGRTTATSDAWPACSRAFPPRCPPPP
jgi:hypothetical protein